MPNNLDGLILRKQVDYRAEWAGSSAGYHRFDIDASA